MIADDEELFGNSEQLEVKNIEYRWETHGSMLIDIHRGIYRTWINRSDGTSEVRDVPSGRIFLPAFPIEN